MDILYWIAGIVAFLLISTYLLKRIFKVQTIAKIISIAKTERFNGFIEKISRTKLWDYLADIGLVLGFGTIAIDYLYGRKKTLPKRLLIAATSIVGLFALFFFLSVLFFNFSGPLVLLFASTFAIGGLMFFTLISLVYQAFDIISKLLIGKVACPGIMPIIPGVKIPNVPEVLTPPLSVWITFLIVMVIHEFSHGALVKRCKVKIKSVGVLLVGLIPIGAFVEPDEKELVKRSAREQLRVYAIGPASNFYSMPVFLAIVLVISLIVSPYVGSTINSMEKNIEMESILITGIKDDYKLCGDAVEIPAKGEIEEGWILQKYNGIELNTFQDLSMASRKSDKNVSMVFKIKDGSIIEKTIEKNWRGELGIIMGFKYVPGKEPTDEYLNLLFVIETFQTFIFWLFLISFALASVNFLPMVPFDGGKIAKIIFLPYFGFMNMNKKDTEKLIGRLFMWIILILILINAIPLFL